MDELPIAERLALTILGGGLLLGDQAHQAHLREEAAQANEAEREYEAMKMDQTLAALEGRDKMAMSLLLPAVRAAADKTAELLKEAVGSPAPPAAPSFVAPAATSGARWARRGARAVGAPAAEAAAPAAASAAKPLLGAMGKAKLVGGLGLLGAGYLGYKGLQAARDYMSLPSGSHAGPPLAHNVNEYGYPQY